MADDLRVQLTAMARLIDRTLHRLDDAESAVRQLCAEVAAINARAAATEPDQTGDRSWLLLADPDEAHAVLADLLDWLARVYLHYPATALPSCWAWHPAVVEELWWLRQAHHDALNARTGSPGKLADWHDRHRPGVTQRIRLALRDCELALHAQPWPALGVPLPGSAQRIAATWTTARTQPQPTPDELDAALQHDRAQHRSNRRSAPPRSTN